MKMMKVEFFIHMKSMNCCSENFFTFYKENGNWFIEECSQRPLGSKKLIPLNSFIGKKVGELEKFIGMRIKQQEKDFIWFDYYYLYEDKCNRNKILNMMEEAIKDLMKKFLIINMNNVVLKERIEAFLNESR